MTAMLYHFLWLLISITQHSVNSIGQMVELLEVGQCIRTEDWFHIYSCMVLLFGNAHMQICHIFGYGCIENAGHGLSYYGLLHLVYFRFMALIQTLFMEEWIAFDPDGFICISISIIIYILDKECKDKVLIIQDIYLLILL